MPDEDFRQLQSRFRWMLIALLVSIAGLLVLGAAGWKAYDRGSNWKARSLALREELLYREQLGVAATVPLNRFSHLLTTRQVPDALRQLPNIAVSFGKSEETLNLEQLIEKLEEPCRKYNRSCPVSRPKDNSAAAKQ
ncbi:hypothetical protein C4587_03050 [Candidatus Parcubacteria bacterium]|nr:MAG: hypothetical protein C4587_03050 [Candidatus Parcubacteria bacterium]